MGRRFVDMRTIQNRMNAKDARIARETAARQLRSADAAKGSQRFEGGPMKDELARRASSKDRILALLETQRSVLSTDLNAISFRYGARLMELRADGHAITTEQVKPGLYRYIYEGKKTRPPADLNNIERELYT